MRMTQATLPLVGIPKTNGEANKIDPSDLPVHDWYRFVLSFPPHLVRQYLEKFELGKGSTLLDPFCGTGTTVVECKKRGFDAIGIEALPMPAFASKTKTFWSIDPEQLRRHATSIADRTLEDLQKQGVADDLSLPKSNPATNLRTLPSETLRLLLKDSISPLPLHKALVLLDHIRGGRDNPLKDIELLALAKALVSNIGNLKFGPEVGIGKLKHNSLVVQPWLENVVLMANDLSLLSGTTWPQSTIHKADARDASSVVEPSSVDAVFTSPPYPNEKDYTRTTRLETVILGLASNMDDLRKAKKTLIRSNTRSVYKSDTDDDFVMHNSKIQAIAKEIEKRRIELGKTSGFERLYHRVTKLYFGGMVHHLSALRLVLRPGARLGYVVGDQASYLRVMIRTGQILAELAEQLGYSVESIDLFRTRLATATGEQLREEVLILRWPG